MLEQKIRYLIYGTGALGSVFGGFLQKSGCDVTYIGLGDHYERILKDGIKITGIWGDHTIFPIRGFHHSSELQDKYDIILFCVKSTDTEAAAPQSVKLLSENGIIVSVQNGLNNVETLAKYAGPERTIGGRIIFGVEIPTPGTAKVTVYADKVLIGSPFLTKNSETTTSLNENLVERLKKDLNIAGIPTEIVSNILAFIWGKMLYNSALNPLGAILAVSYGGLGDNLETRNIMEEIIKEIFAVMNAKRIKTIYVDSQEYFNVLLQKQLPPTREHHSSMYQDIIHGRRTEIDTLNGAIVKYGKEIGIPTPYNEMITRLIHFKEQKKKD